MLIGKSHRTLYPHQVHSKLVKFHLWVDYPFNKGMLSCSDKKLPHPSIHAVTTQPTATDPASFSLKDADWLLSFGFD